MTFFVIRLAKVCYYKQLILLDLIVMVVYRHRLALDYYWLFAKLLFMIVICGVVGYSTSASALLVLYLPNYPIKDNDLLSRQNLTQLQAKKIRHQYQAITIDNQEYYLGKFERQTNTPTAIFLVLHDSENGAFDSGLQWIADNGGQMWVLENQEQRNLFDFMRHKTTLTDPNRLFWGLDSATAISLELPTKPSEKNSIVKTNPYAPFANYLLEQIGVKPAISQPSTPTRSVPMILVALHNNSPTGQFGMDNIARFGNTHIACQQDNAPKNLYWIASNTKADSPITLNSQALIQKLCQHSAVNVVSETAPTVADGDGSLSVYMANHAPNWQYVNIEIKAGKKGNPVDEQRAKQQQLNYIDNLLN